MSQDPKVLHCIVDETAIITNLDEIEQWVENGLITLVLPLHTLERLHILKKDPSSIGANAKDAVKFLDEITSTAKLQHDPVTIQGPDDQYAQWAEVEEHYLAHTKVDGGVETPIPTNHAVLTPPAETRSPVHGQSSTVDPELPIGELSLDNQHKATSPSSTPPLSPASEPQSAKTTPEVKTVNMHRHDVSPVPPTLKSLINPVVWYMHETPKKQPDKTLAFLTNSADTAILVRDFGVVPKTIHQLRATLNTIEPEAKTPRRGQKKQGKRDSMRKQKDDKPKTLFRYDEESEEDEEGEEVLFQPRNRVGPRPSSSGRGKTTTPRGRAAHSPSNSITSPPQPKPQIPVEEIDPDSFDRGSFARGSTPLANVGNVSSYISPSFARGQPRTPSAPRGPFRGGAPRGANRGRGRLFVP